MTIEAVLLSVWMAGLIPLLRANVLRMSQALLFLGAYVFSMLLMSPDLDLSKSDAYSRWGALRWMWLPYAWAFRHRQASHHLLLGPLTRILYIALVGFAGTLIYHLSTGQPVPQWRLSVAVSLPVFLGLYLPNIEHIMADQISTAHRRKRRGRRL